MVFQCSCNLHFSYMYSFQYLCIFMHTHSALSVHVFLCILRVLNTLGNISALSVLSCQYFLQINCLSSDFTDSFFHNPKFYFLFLCSQMYHFSLLLPLTVVSSELSPYSRDAGIHPLISSTQRVSLFKCRTLILLEFIFCV